MISTPSLIIVCFFVFLAGFIDSIAGGGGLISLPAYFFVGIPAHTAMGCNKFSSAVGTTVAAARFFKNKALDFKVALVSALGSFIAAGMASYIALLIPEKTLKLMFTCVLPFVAIFILSKKNLGSENNSYLLERKKAYFFALIIGILIGFYDGLLGPGTGTFAIIAYSLIMNYDLKNASGNAKILNIASNYASLIVFLVQGKVLFAIAIPAAIAGLLGNYLGAGFAIKKGNSFIRPVMLLVITLLFGKMFFDVFGTYIYNFSK